MYNENDLIILNMESTENNYNTIYRNAKRLMKMKRKEVIKFLKDNIYFYDKINWNKFKIKEFKKYLKEMYLNQ